MAHGITSPARAPGHLVPSPGPQERRGDSFRQAIFSPPQEHPGMYTYSPTQTNKIKRKAQHSGGRYLGTGGWPGIHNESQASQVCSEGSCWKK